MTKTKVSVLRHLFQKIVILKITQLVALHSSEQSFHQLRRSGDLVAAFQVLRDTTAYIYPVFSCLFLCFAIRLSFDLNLLGEACLCISLDHLQNAFYNGECRCSSQRKHLRMKG